MVPLEAHSPSGRQISDFGDLKVHFLRLPA
jgi:hypothetical protein